MIFEEKVFYKLSKYYICYICNMGRSDFPDFPDMYARGRGLQDQGQVQTYQENHNCTCYIYGTLRGRIKGKTSTVFAIKCH